MEALIGEAIIGLIIGIVGWTVKNSIGGVSIKLDMVLANQQKHEVNMAVIEKDVESNKEWGRDSKVKITDHEKRLNEVEKKVSALEAK